jgi:MFS superfamily sulfate permease-like transporter
VRYILGYRVPRVDTLHETIKVLLENIHKFQWKEFVMGMSIIFLLVSLKLIGKRFKKAFWISALGPISACVIGIVAVVAGGLQNRGIKIVEKIPAGKGDPRTSHGSDSITECMSVCDGMHGCEHC